MAVRTFKASAQAFNYFEGCCEKALEYVAKELTEKLRGYIREDFYDLYKPLVYNRSYMFARSPKFNLLGKSSAEVFIDTDVMHYLGVSGEDVATMASYGFHGSSDIYRPGFYWTDFIKYCDENVPVLFKVGLLKQGIPVK